MEQNTLEWREARAGKITASRMCDVLAFGKRDGKPLKARQDYIGDIVAEMLTGEPKEQVKARPLDWGHDVEAAARVAYEAETGEIVQQVGFFIHPLLPYVGCSPDGMIGADGQTQIKCPNNPAVHIATLRDGIPEEHIPQVQAEMFVTGRSWSDFVSFDPRMPEHLRLYRQRIHRDDKYIEQLAEACASLWAEVQTYINYLNQRAA
jgi:predicted phage-related endonuclease